MYESGQGSDRWSVRGGDPTEESIFSHDPPPDRPSEGSRPRAVLLIAVAAICALLTSASILHTGMLLFVRSVGEKKVPDLVGLEISAARVELERSGYAMAIEREVYTPNFGEGRVVSQRPGPGESFRRGRKIHLTLSMGMKETELPRVTGLTLRQAALELQKAGFAEGGILRVEHPSVEKGAVIAQDPPAGALGSEGAPVNLLVRPGPRQNQSASRKLSGCTSMKRSRFFALPASSSVTSSLARTVFLRREQCSINFPHREVFFHPKKA